MTIRTVRGFPGVLYPVAANDVFSVCHRFQMIRIEAGAIFTKMIQAKTVRDFTNKFLIGDTMHGARAAVAVAL